MTTQLINLVPKAILLGAIILLASVAPTQAQSLGNRIRVNIPFDFTISEKKLPAGEYSVGRALLGADDLVIASPLTECNKTYCNTPTIVTVSNLTFSATSPRVEFFASCL